MSKFCSNCGTPLQPDQNVCSNCGAPTNKTTQQSENQQSYQQNNFAQGNYGTPPYPQNNGNSGLKTAVIILGSILGTILVGLLIWLMISQFSKSGSQEDVTDLSQEENIKAENDSLKRALEDEKNKTKEVVVVKEDVKDDSNSSHSGGSINLSMNGEVGGNSSIWMNGRTGGYWVDYGNGTSAQRKLKVSSFDSSTGKLVLSASDGHKYIGKFVGTVRGSGNRGDYGSYSGTFTNYKGVKLHFSYYD